MSDYTYFDFWLKDQIAGRKAEEIIHKFGRNPAVGTSFAPVSIGGIYRTPQVANATKLRVKAGDADDTAGGSGARKITIQGLNAQGEFTSNEIPTAGLSAGAASQDEFIRLYRAFVSESGTYATQSVGSHADDIVIENAAGTEDWVTIDSTGFPKGQSEIACYTVPLGYVAYVSGQHLYVDSNKTADIIFFQRNLALQSEAPYSAMRTIQSYVGIVGEAEANHVMTPLGPFDQLTDLGYLAAATSTADVSIDFEITLIKRG